MKNKRHSEPEPKQFRIRFRSGADVTPVVKYFMASTSDQALDMFVYSCRNFESPPQLLDFAEWNRWSEKWTELPVPERLPEPA